jgi:hypothetical protein
MDTPTILTRSASEESDGPILTRPDIATVSLLACASGWYEVTRDVSTHQLVCYKALRAQFVRQGVGMIDLS